MNILVNEKDDETKKKNAFCKNVSWEKKKVLMTLRALKKKKLGAATPLSSLFPPSLLITYDPSHSTAKTYFKLSKTSTKRKNKTKSS